LLKKNLGETRVNLDDILNNFDGIAETKKDPYILNETVTNRITDFDKLLSDITTIPKEWQDSEYAKNRPLDNGRLPLILVHGWNGDSDMRDPTKTY